MIDPTVGWFKLCKIKSKRADIIANALKQTWLTQYPCPNVITYDLGTEFTAKFAEMVQNDYKLTCCPITT